MDAVEARLQVAYLYWMRDRILDAVGQLPAHSFLSAQTVTTRDLRATLVHELDVEWSWRERLRDGEFPNSEDLDPDAYMSLSALRAHWRRDETEMRAWVESLTDQALAKPPPNEQATLPLWYYLLHLLAHAIQQFSDAATLLSLAGRSPGELGFLEFADQQQRAAANVEAVGE